MNYQENMRSSIRMQEPLKRVILLYDKIMIVYREYASSRERVIPLFDQWKWFGNTHIPC